MSLEVWVVESQWNPPDVSSEDCLCNVISVNRQLSDAALVLAQEIESNEEDDIDIADLANQIVDAISRAMRKGKQPKFKWGETIYWFHQMEVH